jgi:hypothetical protein
MDTREGFDNPVLTGQLVQIIENYSDSIAETWYREVKDSNYTPSIEKISREDAVKMATDVYKKLGYWLMRTHGQEVKETYHRFGSQLYWKHFRMEEVVMTLVLIKRYLWLHLLEQGLMTTRLELYQALELNNKVVLYFDRAIYFAIIGYKQAQAKDMADLAS